MQVVNFNLPLNEQLKSYKVGIGFKKARDKEGKRAIVWDDKLVKRLFRRYSPIGSMDLTF
jgi:hypothetical protein